MLEVPGYVDAAYPVCIFIENICHFLNGLAFTDRHGSVDINVMTFSYVVENVLQGAELCERLCWLVGSPKADEKNGVRGLQL
jgi:hypothetical protein